MARDKIHIDLVLNTKGFRPLGRINGQLGEFEKSLDASNARVLAFGASAGAILAVKKAFTATVKAAIEVEKSLKDINVILGATSANLKKFGSDLFEIASKTGQAFQVAATAATELARQGLGTEETLKRTRDALILARLAGMDAAEAVNALTAAINTFNKAGLDSTTIINKLANVDAAFAVSSDDLAKAIGRVGSSAKAAGVNFDQLLAIVTTVQQKTARGGAVIGNSFKTIFTRIQRPRVIKELENLGIAIRGVEGDVLPAMKVLQNLARSFDNLSQAQRAQVTELIGGVFQVNILKAAMSDLGKETGIYNRALGVSIGSSDQALRRNEELNKTLAAQFQRTVNTFKEGAAELGELTLGPALERMFGFVDEMSKIGESDFGKVGVAIAKSIFEGLGKFISGPGLLVIGLVLFKTFSQLGKFAADAFKTLTGLNKSLQTQQQLQRQVFDVLSENPDLLKKIKDGTMTVEQAHEEIYKQIEKNTGALDSQLLVSQQLAKSLMTGGVGFSADFGATSGKKSRKFGSAGYMPNFAADRGEVLGMMAGGYSRPQVNNPKTRKESIHDGRGGVFNATVNGHESVFTRQNSQGKKATFVVPPKNSKAYDKYMSVLSGGFIPNFNPQKKLERLLRMEKRYGVKGKGYSALPNASSRKEFRDTLSEITGKGVLNSAPKIGEILTKEINLTRFNKSSKEGGHQRARLRVDKEGNLKDQPTEHVHIRGGKRFVADPKSPKGRQDLNVLKVLDAKQKYGALTMFGSGNTNQGYVEASVGDISQLSESGLEKTNRIGVSNLQFRVLSKGLRDAKQESGFSKAIRSRLATPTQRLAGDIAKGMLPGKGLKPARISSSGAALFGVDAEGNIFETAVNALSSKGAKFEATLKSDRNQHWDFPKGYIGSNAFKTNFDFGGSLEQADAKRSLGEQKTETSLVKKIFNTQPELAGKIPKPPKKRNAGGYIPNFNALFEAVRREKEAGVPAGRIRVGRSDRLKNGSNPSGFGIYNTRDEPMGLTQGINNSMAAGIDPKRKGVASGHIPNFRWNKGLTKKEVTGAGFSWDSAGAKAFKESKTSTEKLTKATDKQTAGAMQTMVMMGMLQQGLTGVENALGENNNVGKGVINALGTVASATVAARYFGSELKETGMSKLSGAGKARVGSAFSSDPEGILAEDPVKRRQRTLGEQLSRDNKAAFLKEQKVNVKKFGGRLDRSGKITGGGGGIKGMMARGGAKASMVGGAMKAGAAGAAASGALTGAVAGFAALNALGTLMTKTDLSATFKEARLAGKALERTKEATEKNIAKLSKFGTAAERAAKTFEDQNATMSQVLDASREMQKQMATLPTEFRGKLAGIFDPAKVNTMIQQFVADQQKKVQEAQVRKDSADTLENVREKGVMDVFANPLDSLSNILTAGNLSGKTPEEMKMDNKAMEGLAAGILQRTIARDKGKFKDMDTDAFLLKMGGAKNDKQRMAVGRELGMSDSDIAVWSKWVQQGGEDFNKLARPMAKLIAETKAHYDAEREMGPIREQLLKQNRAQLKAVKERKRVLESEQRIRKQVIKITAAGAKSFLTEVGKIKLDTQLKVGEAKAEKETQFGGLISQTQKALGSASSGDAFAGTALESQIQGTLAKASRGGVGSVDQGQVDAQTAGLNTMIEEIENSAGPDDALAKQQVEELKTLKAELQNLVGSSDRLDDELKMQTKEIKAAAAAQKMVAEQERRLKSFGGPQALLDPSKLNPTLTKIASGGKAMSAAGRSGSTTGFNRGRINQLSGLQDLFGGELPDNLQKEGVARATQVGVSQIGAMNQALGLGMSREQIQKTAAEQAANLFKGDPQKQNTKALETLTTTLGLNNELVKHSRTDRVEMGAREGQYSIDSSARQRGFAADMASFQEGGNRKSAAQAKLTRQMMAFREMDMRNSQGAGNFSYLDVGVGISRQNVLDARNLSNEELRERFKDERGPTTNPHGTIWERDYGLRGQKEGESRTDYNREMHESLQRQGVEGGKETVKEGAEAVKASYNTFNITAANVSTDGTPSLASIDEGIDGLQKLKDEMKGVKGAIGNMSGGTAALNRELVA